MTEEEFWKRLEFRLSREFDSMNDNALRFLWCDGFMPDDYHMADRPARITGFAWICDERIQDRWAFELIVGKPVRRREDISWDDLLPAEDANGWLFVDPGVRRLTITCAARDSLAD